jgi:hypothetical protein
VLIDLEGYKSDEIFGSSGVSPLSLSLPQPDTPRYCMQNTDSNFMEHISQMQIFLENIIVEPPLPLEEEERIEAEKKACQSKK